MKYFFKQTNIKTKHPRCPNPVLHLSEHDFLNAIQLRLLTKAAYCSLPEKYGVRGEFSFQYNEHYIR